MASPLDILRESARQEEEKKKNSLIPISIATGTGGALAGAGFDSTINRLSRMRGNKASSYTGRLAGGAIAGLAGALGMQNSPNQSARILARLSTGGQMTQEDADFIERMAYNQARTGLV